MYTALKTEACRVRALQLFVFATTVTVCASAFGKPAVTPLRIDAPVVLDGRADEAFWEQAPALEGFQVFEPGSELLYLHSGMWVPGAESGVRWDDPQLAITWPLPPKEISKRDCNLPLLSQLFSVS